MSLGAFLLIAGAALAVAVGLLVYVRGRHPFFRVPVWRVALFFLWGAVAGPLLVLVPYLLILLAGVNLETALGAFLLIGPLEEFAKAAGPLLLVGLVRKWREEPFEWMVAGAAAGVGFAMTENIGYALAFSDKALEVLVLRSLAPMHLVWSALVGYQIGCRRGGMFAAVLVGFAMAAFLHGLWDALCFTGYIGLLVVLFAGQTLGFAWQMRKMAWLCANRSPRRPDPAADAAAAVPRPSPLIACADCAQPYDVVVLRGVELASCRTCPRAVVGRGDLFTFLNAYAGSTGWFEPDAWWRFYWSDGEGTLPCPTCAAAAPVRRFVGHDEPRVAVCSDCAMVVGDRAGLLSLADRFRRRLQTGFGA